MVFRCGYVEGGRAEASSGISAAESQSFNPSHHIRSYYNGYRTASEKEALNGEVKFGNQCTDGTLSIAEAESSGELRKANIMAVTY
ncbi:MAG: hypothetical protein ACPL7O_05240 [Armatimonadota bacterium]